MALSKEETEFAFEEYKTLREEISKKQDNHYKILSLGVGGITLLFGFVFEYNINKLFIVMPFLIIANNSLYLAEKIAMIKVGKYIEKLEENLYSEKRVLGWQHFIKIRDYKTFDLVAMIIFFSLFVFSLINGLIFICGSDIILSKNMRIIISVCYMFFTLILYTFILINYFKEVYYEKN
ncbi:hypothetical protein [uncultured Desulfobacter sp.]|uniref:hypothetical protein n=1 Tax=uncultured Desulfobacter sp. TaxID=240139 RepID=UPI0029F52BE5|nr:hypothetical protein [uncultured Desulfobacter sp.]